MDRRILGRTGLSVGVIAFGAATFGGFGLKDEAACVRLVREAIDAGVNLFDTADFYGLGLSETIVGKALAGVRHKVVLASKCGMPMSADPNERGGSRRWINRAVEASLKRLGTDHIDLYQLHQSDPLTDIEETLEAMNGLIRAGKVGYFGASNFTAAMVSEAQLRARAAHLVPPHTEQSAYSIFRRHPENELLPSCQRYDVGFLAYSPLDAGWLSGRYRKDQAIEHSPRQRLQPVMFDTTRPEIAPKLDAVEALVGVADAAGVSLPDLAVGFVLAHPAVTCALVGGSRPEHYAPYIDGRAFRLGDDVLDAIDAIVPPGATLPPPDPRAPARHLRRRSRLDLEAAGEAAPANRMLDMQLKRTEKDWSPR